MKEQLYTIPVNDAFNGEHECPLCTLRNDLERNAVEFTLGPSYMEDDNRAVTDSLGFCEKHIQTLYQQKNRLGLALILSTHIAKITRDLEQLSKEPAQAGKGLLKKKTDTPMSAYISSLEQNCFVCDRVKTVFQRYIETIFHMYKKDPAFPEKLHGSKGFCTYHYALLFEQAPDYLAKDQLSSFLSDLNTTYFTNMRRTQADLAWFINKFDYRYQNEPWKNAKDALPRAVLKSHSAVTPDLNDMPGQQ